MGKRSLDDWRRSVFRSTTLSDRAKVVLLYLAEHMREDRRVSVPRHKIARDLGKSERRISERITEAHDLGWLSTIVRGQKGVTAVYQGLFPDPVSGTHARPLNRRSSEFSGTPTSPLNSAETRPLNDPNHALRGHTSVPPIQERTYSSVVTDRNESSNEKACRFHGWTVCPADCADHPATRRRTA